MSRLWKRIQRDCRAMVRRQMRLPDERSRVLDSGQCDSLNWIAGKLPTTGVVLADEVGTGKTRIACAVVSAVLRAGGRAAVVVPQGLMHQWKAEARQLDAQIPDPIELTSARDILSPGEQHEQDKLAAKNPSRTGRDWWLISQSFRTPQVRTGKDPAEWRLALPSYVRALLAPRSTRLDGRTRYGSVLAKQVEPLKCVAERIVEVIAQRNERSEWRKRLDRLPIYRRGLDNDALIAALQADGDGRCILEQLLGLWLGWFDLIIVDEAHRSRDELPLAPEGGDGSRSEGATKVLGRLLEHVLVQPPRGRRICMTATPMELELSQWKDLVWRADAAVDMKDVDAAASALRAAADRARATPDEKETIEALCGASHNFVRVLAPVVTRRLRDSDGRIKAFQAQTGACGHHPHRNLKTVEIRIPDSNAGAPAWRDILFASECMARSARGLSVADLQGSPRALKDAYTKLAAGHLSADIFDTHRLTSDNDDDLGKPSYQQRMRVRYWHQELVKHHQLLAGRSRRGSDAVVDTLHPRILAAVEEIERWTTPKQVTDDALDEPEKVLVFGVFLKPLRWLRDVLNVRHALRTVDAGRPLAHAIHQDKWLMQIAKSQLGQMAAAQQLSNHLNGASHRSLKHKLYESHRTYELTRKRHRRRLNTIVRGWFEQEPSLESFASQSELVVAITDHVSAHVMEHTLGAGSSKPSSDTETLKELAEQWRTQSLTELLSSDDLAEEATGARSAELLKSLKEAFVSEVDARHSRHARLLQGDTMWGTRKLLQAAFNRPGASPRVLIAQSQVGREGLNLHEACRVVIQFHAEWNPAVLEQQVGRVDRKGSRWDNLAATWLSGGCVGEPPFIEVRQLVFDGTYDAFQWDRLGRRQHDFDASLFGALLPQDALARVPVELRPELTKAAPSFVPPPA